MSGNLKYILFITLGLSLSISCSKSGKRATKENTGIEYASEQLSNENAIAIDQKTKEERYGLSTTVKMEKIHGVNQIPVEINGVKMHFIFDTGASIISISETEAIFLFKQGSLRKEDILGTADFSDANGDISEGTIINLRTVKIGSQILKDVKASVVHNSIAPLLFGQSALEKFGKISIDNNKQELTFEY
jgi:aspartyl protease family protein